MDANDPTPPTVTTRPQRRYSDAEQAEALAALAANGGEIAATSRETGIPEATLRHWRDGDCRPCPPELVARKRESLARGIEKLARRVLKRNLKAAADADTPLSLRDGAVVLGICVDKVAQLRGESGGGASITVNVDARSVTLTADDVAAARKLLGASAAPRTLAEHPENVANPAG